ncbi:hypothetical protein AK812_SmicGene7372 [Symbiodinium microadriaticum]|uniref:Uncharacterized protein n=1 Tax=Symbiodinium microadriaticum TaxID=2951 RepID=A0A1Q9ENS5_SYMMI|nr:hypothetical protein AK812_SmicGene7372 [Symbiodinium microadriaticum]
MTKVFDGKGSQPDLFAAATRFVLDENEGLLLAMFGGRTARMLFFTGTDEQVRATLDGFKVLSWSELSYYVPGEEDDSKTRLANIEQLVELGRSLLVTCSLSIESGIAGTEERLAARAASGLEASNWYFQELGPTVLAAMHNKRHHGAHTYVGSGKWWRLHLEMMSLNYALRAKRIVNNVAGLHLKTHQLSEILLYSKAHPKKKELPNNRGSKPDTDLRNHRDLLTLVELRILPGNHQRSVRDALAFECDLNSAQLPQAGAGELPVPLNTLVREAARCWSKLHGQKLGDWRTPRLSPMGAARTVAQCFRHEACECFYEFTGHWKSDEKYCLVVRKSGECHDNPRQARQHAMQGQSDTDTESSRRWHCQEGIFS